MLMLFKKKKKKDALIRQIFYSIKMPVSFLLVYKQMLKKNCFFFFSRKKSEIIHAKKNLLFSTS